MNIKCGQKYKKHKILDVRLGITITNKNKYMIKPSWDN